MNKPFARIISIVTLIIFLGRSNKKENEVVFKKEDPVKEDAVKAWLYKVENYKKNKNYLPVFYNYYNQKIKKKILKCG